MGLCLGLFIGFFLAFPYLVHGLVNVSGAAGTPAGPALAIVLAIYLKPVAYLIFAAAIAAIATARARSVGMPRKVGVCIALLVLADLPFGMVFGSHWGVSFATGLYMESPPVSLLAAVIALVALGFVHESAGPMTVPYAAAYSFWVSLLILLTAIGLIGFMFHFWPLFFGIGGIGLLKLLRTVDTLLRLLTFYPSVPLAVFAAASVHLALRSRDQTGRPTGASGFVTRVRKILGLQR